MAKKYIIVNDVCGRPCRMTEENFCKMIKKKIPIDEFGLDEVYEVINRKNFDADKRIEVCKDILKGYHKHLKTTRISDLEQIRVFRFWWLYRDYLEEIGEFDLLILDYVSRTVAGITYESKVLSKEHYNTFISCFFKMQIEQFREIKEFEDLEKWIKALAPAYKALLADEEVRSYSI